MEATKEAAATYKRPTAWHRKDVLPMLFNSKLPLRFWSKVCADASSCWLWTASISQGGYGRYSTRHQWWEGAHRVAYQALIGPIPDGLTLDHLCRNRTCVNPAHLEPVSNRTNILRGESLSAQRARVTHCVYGHEFTFQNTHYRRNGTRKCRVCMEKKLARYIASKS